jgi:hypothetical protein
MVGCVTVPGNSGSRVYRSVGLKRLAITIPPKHALEEKKSRNQGKRNLSEPSEQIVFVVRDSWFLV